jgi:hypothetical protein
LAINAKLFFLQLLKRMTIFFNWKLNMEGRSLSNYTLYRYSSSMLMYRGKHLGQSFPGMKLLKRLAVNRHFGKYFDRGKVFPIQMVTGIGFTPEGMKGNLVVLKKK